jgi:hypothetical protein
MTRSRVLWNRELMVEAAGVEPASEKARPAVTTCVSDSLFFDQSLENQQDATGLVRLISVSSYEQKPFDPACHMTLTGCHAGLTPEAATLD